MPWEIISNVITPNRILAITMMAVELWNNLILIYKNLKITWNKPRNKKGKVIENEF